MPRVSVVIAARDAGGTITEALGSVRAQSYRDWEVIVVDDGSADATGELAAQHGARVVRHEVAQGPAAARNAGAAVATGELLATLDADDAWREGFLATQVAAFDRAPRRPGVVSCDAVVRGVDGRLSDATWHQLVGPPPENVEQLLRANTIFTSVVLARDLFEAAGGYAADMVHAEDYDLWLRIAAAGHPLVHTPRALAVYRLSPDGLSADRLKLAAGTREAYDRALRRGNLTRRQRGIARRQRRLYDLLIRRADVSGLARLKLAPALMRVVLEHPERWSGWLRAGRTRAGGRFSRELR